MVNYHVTPGNLSQVRQGLREAFGSSKFLVAVTGAGISIASGLPLTKDAVNGVPLDEFFRLSFFKKSPQRFYEVYRETIHKWRKAVPNQAHRALTKRGVWVITQNIDGLHRDAGTEHLIELHGNLRELYCPSCSKILDNSLAFSDAVPRCPECKHILNPGISLEGQEVRHFSLAVDWAGRAEILLIIGTDLEMEPVRHLPRIAADNGAEVVWINESAEKLVPELLG